MEAFARPLKRLINALVRLPSIGEKTATRLALYILRAQKDEVMELAHALIDVKERVRTCSICFNFSDKDPCPICGDPSRNTEMVCVVEEAGDLIAIEASGSFKGRYHVLQGVISPVDGINPEDLRIEELVRRIKADNEIQEVIIATNPSLEGEATSLYLARILKPLGVRVTRIGYGIPAGGDVEYTDRITLGKAIENRREL